MRTDEQILNEKFKDNLPAEFEGKIWDDKLLAAMKEARDEYAENLLVFALKNFDLKGPITNEKAIIIVQMFNAHLAAQK